MKKLLTLIVLISVAALGFAAEPVVRVNDLGNAYLVNADGSETNIGAPYDAIANNPALGSAIQKAAALRLAQLKTDTAAQIKAAQDASAKAISDNAAELAELRGKVAKLEAELAAEKARNQAR